MIAAIVALVRPRVAPTAPPGVPARPFWFGLALTLPNLAALSAWIAVAGALALPSLAAAVAAAIGVTVGSAAYFATLAWVAARARPTRSGAPLGHRVNAAALGLVGLVVLARGAWLLA